MNPFFHQLHPWNVSRETFTKLEEFVALLQKWNSKINLIGPSTLDTIWQRHIMDSAQLLNLIPTTKQTITDLGSGAGFPGLIIAMLSQHEVHLVESDTKKAAFLRQAALLANHNVTVHNERIESLAPWHSDIITARALAPLSKLLELAWPFYSQNASCLFLKGVKIKDELADCEALWDMHTTLYPSLTQESASIIRIQQLHKKGS